MSDLAGKDDAKRKMKVGDGMGGQIALIEDDPDFSFLSSLILKEEGFKVSSFSFGEEFLEQVKDSPDLFDLVLCDYRLPDSNGLGLYKTSKQLGVQCPFLMITAFGDFDVAVEAMKVGISDYLIKPVEKDVLVKKVSSYLERRSLEEEVLFNRFDRRIVARSSVMQSILKKLSRLTKSKASILLQGESGTGKEVLAGLLHEASSRSQKRFVPVNVSAIPDGLFEAEFFGYRKGAFTDALRDHEGHARVAHEGTLFLDEVGEMSLQSQAKLLRLLEEGKVQPLGSTEVYTVDLRLLCATNKDLLTLVKEGKFREDLYYRIAVISIQIPPLRDRNEDIIPLARFLLRNLAGQEGVEVIDFTPQAQEKLLSYSWPGNVRELKNRIHEALLATDEKWIDSLHLSAFSEDRSSKNTLSFTEAKANFEKAYILRLLKSAKGNINVVAQLSGLSRKAIYDLMNRHQIKPERFRH